LIEAECLAAERLLARRPVPPTLARRPGWIEGIVATLQWAGIPNCDTSPSHGVRWTGVSHGPDAAVGHMNSCLA
jgi:hypothetical protein